MLQRSNYKIAPVFFWRENITFLNSALHQLFKCPGKTQNNTCWHFASSPHFLANESCWILTRQMLEKCVVPLKKIPLSASISCLIHSWSIWDIDQVVCGKIKINHKSTKIKDKLLACFIQLINLATVRELSVNISLIQWKMSGRRLDLLINSVLLLIGYTCKFLPK